MAALPTLVDVIRGEDFASQGSADLANQLRAVVLSFNVSIQPISDAATIVRPANLRNLAPDHTLILVNGKRRHRAAVITWLGNGIADGSQGPDLSVIPSIAIRQAEVLRDGAAAQYGSDAIAGVMLVVEAGGRRAPQTSGLNGRACPSLPTTSCSGPPEFTERERPSTTSAGRGSPCYSASRPSPAWAMTSVAKLVPPEQGGDGAEDHHLVP